MNKKYDLIVMPGRFEPLHKGHIKNAREAMLLADNVLFLVGSINQPRTIKNPFTFKERKEMIDSVFPQSNVSVSGVEDNLYNDHLWVMSVREETEKRLLELGLDKKTAKVAILGHEKDESSYYLKLFPTWNFEATDGYASVGGKTIDATKIRELFFEGDLSFIESVLDRQVFHIMNVFTDTQHYADLVEEYKFIKKYKEAWKSAPYAPTFNTVDAVVVQSDNILLIQRKAAPGKGLWALPGGFLNGSTIKGDGPKTFLKQKAETFAEGCVRELIEETKIKVPRRTLEGIVNNCYQKCFDHPDRSLRGRTITQAFLIQLDDPNGLPKVKGSDDAKVAKWFTFAEVEKMSDQLFEDHFSIINHMIGKLN